MHPIEKSMAPYNEECGNPFLPFAASTTQKKKLHQKNKQRDQRVLQSSTDSVEMTQTQKKEPTSKRKNVPQINTTKHKIMTGRHNWNTRRYHTDKGSDFGIKINTKKIVYIALMASISVMVGLNVVYLRRISSMMMTMEDTNLPFLRNNSNKLYDSQKSLSIVVHLEGALGNHLAKLAYGLMIQSMARQRGIKTSLHLMSQDEDYDNWDWYSVHLRTWVRQSMKRCFPNLRSFMFLEGNEENFQEYSRKHNQMLGPRLASQVNIGRGVCREEFCLDSSVEKALETVQEVWQRGELNLQSGQWNSTLKNETVLGPYSFPMIITKQMPDWHMYGRFHDDIVDFFQVDEHCYEVKAYPDEVVFYYRNFHQDNNVNNVSKPWYDNMSHDSIAANLLGHLKQGDKLAIVVHKRVFVKPLIRKMRARNVTVRVISNKDFLVDFFFLLSAQREMIGRAESTFFHWAAMLNKRVKRTRLFFFDNGSEFKSRYVPIEFPPIMESLELRKRFFFELYKI